MVTYLSFRSQLKFHLLQEAFPDPTASASELLQHFLPVLPSVVRYRPTSECLTALHQGFLYFTDHTDRPSFPGRLYFCDASLGHKYDNA